MYVILYVLLNTSIQTNSTNYRQSSSNIRCLLACFSLFCSSSRDVDIEKTEYENLLIQYRRNVRIKSDFRLELCAQQQCNDLAYQYCHTL